MCVFCVLKARQDEQQATCQEIMRIQLSSHDIKPEEVESSLEILKTGVYNTLSFLSATRDLPTLAPCVREGALQALDEIHTALSADLFPEPKNG